MSDIILLVQQVGFPIALSIWLILIIRKELREIRDCLITVKECMKRIEREVCADE